MVGRKSLRLEVICKREHARSTAVEMRFERLIVFTDSGMMLKTRVYIAITHDKAALRLQRGIAEIVRQFDHLHCLTGLLML